MSWIFTLSAVAAALGLGAVMLITLGAKPVTGFATMFNAGMAIQQIFTTLSDHGLGNRYLESRLVTAFKAPGIAPQTAPPRIPMQRIIGMEIKELRSGS